MPAPNEALPGRDYEIEPVEVPPLRDEMERKARMALVNEQLREVDWSLGKWARVPRVCASISSSAGLLLATFVLRAGLKDPSALSGDIGELVTSGLVGQALGVASLGIGNV